MALELAIPDSGPLISLGRMARLDLLDRFDCPIVITGMIRLTGRIAPQPLTRRAVCVR